MRVDRSEGNAQERVGRSSRRDDGHADDQDQRQLGEVGQPAARESNGRKDRCKSSGGRQRDGRENPDRRTEAEAEDD